LESLNIEVVGDLGIILDIGAILLRGSHSLRKVILSGMCRDRFDDSFALKKLLEDLKAKNITFTC